ncbi:hypothetical protein evm_013715 [Chilo suppressalis]|nr:hypothetical protein evm_013715 [Chilo suppressalis]
MLQSTWSYFESGHGKSAADGIGGCVKRMLDRKTCYGMDITNAKDAYNVLKQSLNTVKVFLIAEERVAEITKLLPKDLIPLKGTMNLHQIITTHNPNILKFRDVSCFCEPLRGNCACFSTRSHTMLKRHLDDDKENLSLPSTSKISNSHSGLVDITLKLVETVPLKENNMQVEVSPHHGITQSVANGCMFVNIDPLATDCDLTQKTTIHSIESYTYDSIDLNEIGNVISDCSKNIDLMEIDLLPIVMSCDKKQFRKYLVQEYHKCTSILGRKIKCMSCEKCAGGYSFFDYICDTCLQVVKAQLLEGPEMNAENQPINGSNSEKNDEFFDFDSDSGSEAETIDLRKRADLINSNFCRKQWRSSPDIQQRSPIIANTSMSIPNQTDEPTTLSNPSHSLTDNQPTLVNNFSTFCLFCRLLNSGGFRLIPASGICVCGSRALGASTFQLVRDALVLGTPSWRLEYWIILKKTRE